jgi:hypothetical protein
MFTRKIKYALATLALIAAGSANASVIDNWHSITAPEHVVFGNDFDHSGSFNDTYLFSLTNGANAFGGTLELDFLSGLDLDLLSVSLWSSGSLLDYDTSPGSFSFTGLGAGSYSFIVSGAVSGHKWGWFDPGVAYVGKIDFTKSYTAVSEPSTFALAGLSLIGLALVMRRRLFN